MSNQCPPNLPMRCAIPAKLFSAGPHVSCCPLSILSKSKLPLSLPPGSARNLPQRGDLLIHPETRHEASGVKRLKVPSGEKNALAYFGCNPRQKMLSDYFHRVSSSPVVWFTGQFAAGSDSLTDQQSNRGRFRGTPPVPEPAKSMTKACKLFCCPLAHFHRSWHCSNSLAQLFALQTRTVVSISSFLVRGSGRVYLHSMHTRSEPSHSTVSPLAPGERAVYPMPQPCR